jgi:hypothetical protein
MMHQPNPKPPSHKRVKAKRDRLEAKIKKAVRAQTVERDGHCFIFSRLPAGLRALLGPCAGSSEWAHIGEHRRFKTRGLPPEERHTTAGTAQMCEKHHDAYDAHEFDIETFGGDGMNSLIIGIVRRAA